MQSEIMAEPERFVVPDPELPLALLDQKEVTKYAYFLLGMFGLCYTRNFYFSNVLFPNIKILWGCLTLCDAGIWRRVKVVPFLDFEVEFLKARMPLCSSFCYFFRFSKYPTSNLANCSGFIL